MPLTFRARTLLQWTSHLGTTYRGSGRKTLSWNLWGYTYSLVCLLLFDRMVLGCCLSSCSNQRIASFNNTGSYDSCQSGEARTSSELCDCLSKLKSEEQRKHLLERYHLVFCDILPFHKHLTVLSNTAKCKETLNKIVQADCAVSLDNSRFEDIVSRIDCRQKYSVRWTCNDCKVAYKQFLCTSKVLPLMLTKNKSACTLGSCKKVLQRCPYFLPNSESQWSGQSVFECNLDTSDSSDCINASQDQTQNPHSVANSHVSSGS